MLYVVRGNVHTASPFEDVIGTQIRVPHFHLSPLTFPSFAQATAGKATVNLLSTSFPIWGIQSHPSSHLSPKKLVLKPC